MMEVPSFTFHILPSYKNEVMMNLKTLLKYFQFIQFIIVIKCASHTLYDLILKYFEVILMTPWVNWFK